MDGVLTMRMKKSNKISNVCCVNEKGVAIVLVLLILMTLTALGIGVITSTSTNMALTRNFETNMEAQNMADIGAKVAYREFINAAFLKTTHKVNKSAPQTGDSLLTTTLSNYTVDGNGDFVWEWDESKGYDPMWDTTKPHGFKFRVYFSTSSNAFVVESEGWFDQIHRRTRAKGQIETMFQFSYFASRDMGEFVRGAAQVIRGKVHANGNMYVRPSDARLDVKTSQFTASGSIIRTRDAWGRPDDASFTNGRCYISKDSESGTLTEMLPGKYGIRGSDGSAFDSFGADWDSQTIGARSVWGGVVRDKVPYKSPPPVQNLDPGQYYEQKAQSAGKVIDSNSHTTYSAWCSRITTFWNYAEQRYQTIWQIDIKQMIATSGAWPTNGMIYAKVPIRLANADSLKTALIVASCRNIYTKGNVNTKNKKGCSIMTKHRIYHLSKNFSDATSTNSKNIAVTVDTTYVNAALVDGAPTVDEYNWVDRDGDHRYDNNSVLIYNDWDHKTKAGFNIPYSDQDPWANCDDLLENWSGKYLRKLGSTVHLNSSYGIMCSNLNNSGITDDQIAWVRKTAYSPPTRIYEYDSALATPSGQPPFTPLIGHITSWAPY